MPQIQDKLIEAVASIREMQQHVRDKSPDGDNSKFMVDEEGAAGMAYFGKLNDFFQGLDNYLGLPHPRALEAMMHEHLSQVCHVRMWTLLCTLEAGTQWCCFSSPVIRQESILILVCFS
jgi:hypothetical protein